MKSFKSDYKNYLNYKNINQHITAPKHHQITIVVSFYIISDTI